MKKKIFNYATNKFENLNAEDDLRPPDVYEINEALNKNRRKDDQIKEVPSSIEDYQDEERARRLAETYAEVKKNPNKFSNKSAIDKWAVIHKSMTPKERREFYKDKKEKPKDMYDDIPKVVMPDPMPMPKIDLEFSKKIFPNTIDDDAYLESLKPKPDKDLEKGLGYLMGVKIKD